MDVQSDVGELLPMFVAEQLFQRQMVFAGTARAMVGAYSSLVRISGTFTASAGAQSPLS